MSRTSRWIGLAVALASVMMLLALERAGAQDKTEKAKGPARPAPQDKADKVKGPARPAGRPTPKTADPRFTDDLTIPTDRESKRLIQAAQDYIKKKEWRIACECLQ